MKHRPARDRNATAISASEFRSGVTLATTYRRAREDPDHRVRIEAVRALVSVDDVGGVVAATGDENREVRIAAAAGLATLRGGAGGIRALLADLDPLVRAAALAALGELGCGAEDFVVVERALRAPAWQVRQGAARALTGAVAELAAPAISKLSDALSDAHLDVRKAAVLSLTRWVGEPGARDALRIALKDSDADVRAYARRALDGASSRRN